jgi:hypothetical protein
MSAALPPLLTFSFVDACMVPSSARPSCRQRQRHSAFNAQSTWTRSSATTGVHQEVQWQQQRKRALNCFRPLRAPIIVVYLSPWHENYTSHAHLLFQWSCGCNG